jgi:hypothetical protein
VGRLNAKLWLSYKCFAKTSRYDGREDDGALYMIGLAEVLACSSAVDFPPMWLFHLSPERKEKGAKVKAPSTQNQWEKGHHLCIASVDWRYCLGPSDLTDFS